MNKEKISIAIGELADRHIQEALDYEKNNYASFRYMAMLKKAIACIVLVIISLFGAAGIAFTANADFRSATIKLFSGLLEEEKISIKNGHNSIAIQ